MSEDPKQKDEASRYEEERLEQEVEESEGGGGGKIGLVIIALLVVAVLAAAYLNRRFYGEREEPIEPIAVVDESEPWPTFDMPDIAPSPHQMAEEYHSFAMYNRIIASQYIFASADRIFVLGAPPRPIMDQDGYERVTPGRLFDITNLADGMTRSSFYRRMIGMDQMLYMDMLPTLGHLPEAPAPRVAPAGEIDLPSTERIISITVNGETRAYPARFLNYHEVVNDEVGGVPVVIAWTALSDAAFALDRRLNEETTLTFSMSGLLYKGANVIYDVDTRSLWTPLTGECLAGEHLGDKLKQIQVVRTRWNYWRENNPEGTVLAGADPPYEGVDYSSDPQVPTETYLTDDALVFPVEGFNMAGSPINGKTQVAGIVVNDSAAAYPLGQVRDRGEIIDTVGEKEIRIRFNADGGYVEFFDDADEPLLGHRMFWMVWQGNYPETKLYGDYEASPQTLETPTMPETPTTPGEFMLR